jgi:hypothetical protein
MESQFNTLSRSYSDNYIQFKVTGNKRYSDAYNAAQQGLENIVSQLETDVSATKQSIADFYKSGVEQKMENLRQQNSFLGRGLMAEKDEAIAATMRQTGSSSIPAIQTWQYIALGVLGVSALGLSVM